MELVAVAVMLLAGIGIAVFVLIAMVIARRANEREAAGNVVRDRENVAASILYQILVIGGVQPADALREVRRQTGIVGPVTAGVDLTNWATAFADTSSPAQCRWLLETAVRLVVARTKVIPLRQYVALLDLSFSLGFHVDALARLREQYGFDYVDHAKDARPLEADRAGAVRFFERDARETAQLLGVLGLEGHQTRQTIIAAYRRMVVQHHPDRFYANSPDEQSNAAARFIEITRVYETLLTIYRD